ncbi:hypothetical protein DTO195F2_1387 [Paecilomyces variotii]|nr:hypothetical protein DTO195F2_1387 [Paecilomyces variotii]KAJ9403408.1 hypothetical protein DTO045G8_8876 [Paecilomyces variotii]
MRFNALIRTHHITSRKKVGALKRAADTHSCWVLLRSGGCPGIMYVEGSTQDDVGSWVDVVRRLRYKDFQLVARPGPLVRESENDASASRDTADRPGLSEVDSVKEFGNIMEQKGIWCWWRKAMGYAGE